MHARIEAVCYLQDSALNARIRKFCAIHGWHLAQASNSAVDLVFVDQVSSAETLRAQYPTAILVIFSKADSSSTGPALRTEEAQALELLFQSDVADHLLLDGITTALNLRSFKQQFFNTQTSEPITKLPHHPELLEAMEHRRQEPAGLLIVQIDHAEHLYANLDPVSKTDLLGALSEHLQTQLPHHAEMGIFDAGCFAIWLPRIDRGALAENAAKLIQCTDAPVIFRNGELHFTVSIGYAHEPALKDPKALWQSAWNAKEQASERGGNQSHNADQSQDRLHELAERIPQAITHEEFSLVLQPQFDISGDKLRGVETLLRWQGLEVGNIHPEHFIPIAEQSGQMARVGDWVLEKACVESATWFEHLSAPISIGVNTSPAQFKNDAIQNQLERLTKERWLNPANLELEFSHADLLHIVDKHRKTLFQLRDAGVRFAIDNLGIGVVDTKKLLRCPADTLKIDRTLVAQIETDENARQLVEHICELGQRFSLRTIAVGVESERQRALLATMGCTDAQGYLFSAPIALKEFQRFLTEDQPQAQTG